jgi:hypothetical protein
MNECKLFGMLSGAAIVLTAALTIITILSGGDWVGYIFGLLVMTLLTCFAALTLAVRVLLRTIEMRVILECGCLAETDTTEGGHCPVHGPQRIAAYDPSIFRVRMSPARQGREPRAQLRSIAFRVLSATGTVTGRTLRRPPSRVDEAQ